MFANLHIVASNGIIRKIEIFMQDLRAVHRSHMIRILVRSSLRDITP